MIIVEILAINIIDVIRLVDIVIVVSLIIPQTNGWGSYLPSRELPLCFRISRRRLLA